MEAEPKKESTSLFDSPSASIQTDSTTDAARNTTLINDRHNNTVLGSSSDPESGIQAQEKPSPQSPAGPNHGQHQPPNGGLTAWVQVAAGFAIFFNTWGVLNTFGVFQTYYETGQLFVESSSNIAWIGAMQSYSVLLGGLISGPIYDRGYFKHLLLSGSFLVVLGFMMLSICHTYWQALLAQGFCSGIGAGLLFVPSLAVLPAYFSTKLGLAMGLAASGSSLGGVVYPIMFYRLINEVGFGWAVRGLGFVALATLLVPIFFMKMGIKPAKPRAILDWTAFTDWPFLIFTLSTAIGFVGLYAMLFYISYFAFETHAASAEMAFYLVPILNVASMFGRTLPNALSDKVGPINRESPGLLRSFEMCDYYVLTAADHSVVPRCSDMRRVNLCHDWGQQSCRNHYHHLALRLLLRRFYCSSARVFRPTNG